MGHYFTNEKLPSNIRRTECFILNNRFTFLTDNGVFSKDGLDFGSRLLLESIPLDEVGGKILDMGCGYGVFGIILSKVTSAHVDMVDVNNRALHLSKMNQKENDIANLNIFNSNIYDNVTKKYDVVITNPPIRAGKGVYLTIINAAFNHLNVDGELWFVMRNNHGVKTVIKDLSKKYNTSVLKKDAGYYVVMVKNGESNL